MLALRNSRSVGLVASCFALLLAGCGVDSRVAAPSQAGTALNGRVHGGQQAIANATISLYAAGAGGNGKGATSQLRQPVLSDANGNFGITGDYTCPASTAQVYLVARGGNPGLGVATNNAASVLVAALGDCGNLSASSFIDIDEVTTVAAAWSLSQFLGTGAIVGASATNATGLRNAFLSTQNLVNTTKGTTPGLALPAGAVLETAKLNTLADVISTCVNSNGGSACTPLFAAATVAGVVPANVLDAALVIVRNPAANVGTVFNLAPASAPFQPVLTTVPNDWTLSVTYTGGGLSLPTQLGVDSTGSVWAANYFGGSVTKLSTTGQPATPNGYPDPVLYESYSLAIDPQDNVWVTNEEGDPGNSYNGSLSKFNSSGTVLSGGGIAAGGLYYPYGVAADTDGTMWVADFGHSAASLLNNDGTAYNANPGYSSSTLPLPVGVALDSAHNAWFAASGSATRVTRAGVITQFSCCRAPSAIAVDQFGNVWVTDYSGTALYELNANGLTLQRLSGVGGITYPEDLAIDGAGTVWVTDFRGANISVFGTASGGAASPVLSPNTGFGPDAGLQEPFGIALDASGNVWVSNFSGSSLTEFIGVAAPVKTAAVGPPVAP